MWFLARLNPTFSAIGLQNSLRRKTKHWKEQRSKQQQNTKVCAVFNVGWSQVGCSSDSFQTPPLAIPSNRAMPTRHLLHSFLFLPSSFFFPSFSSLLLYEISKKSIHQITSNSSFRPHSSRITFLV